MRLVLDTNVVVSALLWGGTPERLIALAGEGAVEFLTSAALLDELEGLLGRPKLAAQFERIESSAQDIFARYTELAQLIDAPPIDEERLRDPDDAAVLACARRARRCHRLRRCRSPGPSHLRWNSRSAARRGRPAGRWVRATRNLGRTRGKPARVQARGCALTPSRSSP